MRKLAGTLAFCAFTSSMAFAGSLSGQYSLQKDCVVKGIQMAFEIPAGKISITEKIPLSGNESIIIQAGEETKPVLALGVGHVDGSFRWGPIPFSVGSYEKNKTNFMENYFLPKQNGGVELMQTVRLVSSVAGLTLISTNSPDGDAIICTFGTKN